MASSCCGFGGIVGKALVIALVAGAIGLFDVYVLREKNIDLAAALNKPSPNGGEPARPRTGPQTTNPVQPDQPAPHHHEDDNMITLERAKELFQRMLTAGDVHFVDARNEDDFAKGRIPAAVLLPPTKFGGTIPAEVDQLSRSATIVIYCGGGDCDASKLSGLRLQELGFKDILIFHDGFPAWEKDNQPVER